MEKVTTYAQPLNSEAYGTPQTVRKFTGGEIPINFPLGMSVEFVVVVVVVVVV